MYTLNTDTSEITRDSDGAVCTVGTGFYDDYAAWCNSGNVPSMVSTPVPDYPKITPAHIVKCLTKTEVNALIGSQDSIVKYVVAIAFTSDSIDMDSDFISSIGYLVQSGIISQGSADKILLG